MAENPWHPRIVPFFVYIVLFTLISFAMDWSLFAYPALYVIQCGLVVWLLWRYRKLVPELTIRFHWLAVVSGVGLTAVWIGLGWWMAGEFDERFALLHAGTPLNQIDYAGREPAYFVYTETHMFERMRDEVSAGLYLVSIGLRLLGMALVVPLFEELFCRSAILRGLQRARLTGTALLQLLTDIPLVGDWLERTGRADNANRQPPMFTKQLRETPVGSITVFGIAVSTIIFMLSHALRDWPGCIACGVVWCLLVWYTNRPGLADQKKLGLGPIAWSHGICNALLWCYTLWSDDWQFM